ncbi:MAG: hypothetical protein ABMA64_28460 [Myxococcota bacterium]
MLLWSAIGCAVAAGPCDGSAFDEVVWAAAKVDAQTRPALVGQGLSEACNLPEPLEKGLMDVGALPPEMRAMSEMSLLADHPELWVAACPAGPGVLAEAISLRSSDRGRFLFEKCDLGRLGFTADGLARANGSVLLAIVTAQALLGGGAPAAETGLLCRALAGV